MWRNLLLHIRSRRFRRDEFLTIILLMLVIFTAPAISDAATCSTVSSCKSGSKVARTTANTTVGAIITAFQTNVEYTVDIILDRLVRLGNNDSQSANARNTSAIGAIDIENSAKLGVATGAVREELAGTFIPSASTCAIVSRNLRLSNVQFAAATTARYEASQRASTDYASNLPTGPTGRGTIQAFSNTFNDSLTGFCDPAVVNPPAGVPCTLVNDSAGQPMAWRFTKPYQAVFSRDTIPVAPADPENRAARLFARMVIEPVPPDPIRGPALLRQEGQSAFIGRQRDIAAINLARGVIDRMIDDRVTDGTPGNESLQQLRLQAWEDATIAYQDALTRAIQGEETNMRDLAALAKDSNRIYLQIYYNLERLAAIKAVHLARSIQQQNSGSGSVAGRVLQRQ